MASSASSSALAISTTRSNNSNGSILLQQSLFVMDIGLLLLGAHGWKWLLKLSPIITITRLSSNLALKSSKLLIPLWRKALVSNVGRTIQKIYKNRSKYSTLSDYTWYVGNTADQNHQEEPTQGA
jgi:hypothetical protein